MTLKTNALKIGAFAVFLTGCTEFEKVGQAPELSPAVHSMEHRVMSGAAIGGKGMTMARRHDPSLWSRSQTSLLGDRRAKARGDILTVVIEIDEEAAISNSTDRSRSASENMGIPQLLGLPQRIDERLPAGASVADAVSANSGSSSSGSGSVRRNEQLTLRVAAAVTKILPNGVLEIMGTQEVRVNYELRELLVSGYVRPEDISRKNEITYDKIASARISYGGRGQISDVQQPRYGQQILDIILPF